MDSFEDARLLDYGVMLEAMRHLKRELDRSLREETALNLVWFEALLRIQRAGGSLTMGELSERISLSSGGITRLVDRLVGEGLVERRSCEADRRVHFVAITGEGRRVLGEALAIHTEDLDRLVFGHLEPDERATLVELMDRIRDTNTRVCAGDGA